MPSANAYANARPTHPPTTGTALEASSASEPVWHFRPPCLRGSRRLLRHGGGQGVGVLDRHLVGLELAGLDVLGPVAGDRVAAGELAQRRRLVVAAGGLAVGAAGVEAAASGRVGRRGQVAGEQDALAPHLDGRVGDGDGRQQRDRVGYMTATRSEMWRTTARSCATTR